MSNKKPADQLAQTSSPQARNVKRSSTFLFSRLNWRSARVDLTVYSSQIIDEFCEENDLMVGLYEPSRMSKRSPVPIQDLIQPYGWRNLCLFIDDRGMTSKKGVFNRSKFRSVCVAGKVPYWDRMKTAEMRAVLIRWAIEEKVPEF